jgi:hypothetical protein
VAAVKATSQTAAAQPPALPWRGRAVLSAAAMFSGAALVVTVFTRVSLALTLLCGSACVAALGRRSFLRLPPAARPIVLERLRTGLLAGVPATAAYDLARLALVEAAGLRFWPFDTLPLFGQAILGTGFPQAAVLAVGTGYHYLNGMFFAAAYAVLFRGRPFAFGVAWALGLEAAMLLVYPRWLPALARVLSEFTIVSLTGHLAYGTTLGLIVQLAPALGRRRMGSGPR